MFAFEETGYGITPLTLFPFIMSDGERDWNLYVNEILNQFSAADEQLRILPTTVGDERQQTIEGLRSQLNDIGKMV